MTSLSSLFVKRPIATALVSLALFVSGIVAYRSLSVSPLPRVDSPTISVSAGLPGASPETMASAIAAPLERRFGRIAGLTEMSSSSTLGNTSIILQFSLDRDVDEVTREVQAAIAAAAADLPIDMPSRPTQRRIDPSDSPIMIIALTSETVPVATLFDLADSVLSPRIGRLEGVGQVFVGGGAQPAVRIRVDADALTSRGLALDDLRAAIDRASSLLPTGSVDEGPRQLGVAARAQLIDTVDFESITVVARDGSVLRLADLATVTRGVVNERAAAWADGKRAVLLIVRREPGANVLATVERIHQIFPALEEALPPSVTLESMVDRSATVRSAVNEVQHSLFLAVVLVVLVVFAFLRSARATFIPSVAVPLSLAGTFLGMAALDFSLNVLSLMALTVATGFVVDDAIVVTENVMRYREQGLGAHEAAERGAREITFTVISITVALLSVFIPIFFMGGAVGRLFREMSVTLAMAIVVSALVSLTVTPAMCAALLRPPPHDAEGRPQRSRLDALGERVFEELQLLYTWLLERTLRHRKSTLLVLLAAVGATVALAVHVPKGLFPQQDTGQLFGSIVAPDDVSYEGLVERQTEVIDLIRRDPAVRHVVAFVGTGPGGGSSNTSSMFVALQPLDEGRASARAVSARITQAVAHDPRIQLFVTPAQDLRIGARPSRAQYQYSLQGDDVALLRREAGRLLTELRRAPELRQASSDQADGSLTLFVRVDRALAARLGISPSDVDTALASAFGQRQISISYQDRNELRVVLEVPSDERDTPDDLERVQIRTGDGRPVPLRTIASIERQRAPLAVNHAGQFSSVTLTFDLAPGASLDDAVRIVEGARARLGIDGSIRAGFAGNARTFESSVGSQPFLILAALVVMYLVLGMLYESLVHPLTILSTLPPAAVGALAALSVFGLELDVVAIIGLVLLVGIVAKNAIMMVDFAIDRQRSHGASALDAIREAATLRFRPILMTTLAAFFGAVPLVVGEGLGAELRRPLGVTIAGGLLAAQLITLFTAPTVFVVLDDAARWVRARLGGAARPIAHDGDTAQPSEP